MKAIWSGSLSFGLVNIPIKLYSAIERRPVTFHLLHGKDQSPIEYRRWCSKGGHEVPWNEVVKGVDIGEGKYYVFTKNELASLKPKKSDIFEVTEFVDGGGIGRVLTDQHYYLGPEKSGLKAFFLLRETLRRTGKVAIGTFVMREREYAAAIEPFGPAMMLTTLNFEDEVRSIEEMEGLKDAPILKKTELELAEQLIGKMTEKRLDISKFHDTYLEKLKEALEKRDLEHLVAVAEEVKPTTEENLIDALKASLEG
jgi:DNA end-binding protein Ku